MEKNIFVQFLFVCLFLLFPLGARGNMSDDNNQTTLSLLRQLDYALAHVQDYDSAHEKVVSSIKQQLEHHKGSIAQEITLTDKLIEAYSKFNYDSTTLYINRSLQLAEQSGNPGIVVLSKLRKAQYYAKTGSYLEAMSIINDIKEEQLPDSLLPSAELFARQHLATFLRRLQACVWRVGILFARQCHP